MDRIIALKKYNQYAKETDEKYGVIAKFKYSDHEILTTVGKVGSMESTMTIFDLRNGNIRQAIPFEDGKGINESRKHYLGEGDVTIESFDRS